MAAFGIGMTVRLGEKYRARMSTVSIFDGDFACDDQVR
jgi:hypothetical protein